MRVHTVVVASVLGMVASSGLAFALTPETTPWSAPKAAVTAQPSAVWVGAPEEGTVAVAPHQSWFAVDGTLRLSGRLGHAELPELRADETYLFVNLAAQSELASAPVTPADVTIVLDRSGSMRGSRMDTALAAARGMIASLRDGDTVSVVAYDESADVIVAPTRLDARSRSFVSSQVRNIDASGHTCLSCGMDRALDLVQRSDDSVHRILLLSDGKANRGMTSSGSFGPIAALARGSQAAVSSIGIGIDYDERLLSQLSRGTNGSHYFVERLDELSSVFAQELDAVAQTVAASASVEVTLAPGVELLEVLDRASTRDGNRLTVPFGSFSPGEDKTLLLRVRLPARDAGISTVGDIALSYIDAASGRRERADGKLEVRFGANASELDATVEARIAQSETVRELEQVNDLITSGRDAEAGLVLAQGRARVKQRRASASSRSVAPTASAARNFDLQEKAFDDAFVNAEEAREQSARGDAAAPATRKAAAKKNTQSLNPFL